MPARPPVDDLSPDQFAALYGRTAPLAPGEIVDLLAGTGIRWWIAGGRAARLGAATTRHHNDTDLVVDRADLEVLRRTLADWHLWEANDGSLRPLLAGDEMTPESTQFWVRKDAVSPWILDVILHPTADEWIFKRDDRVRRPWSLALVERDGVTYLRPEIALLHKAKAHRPKDRADLLAAALDDESRAWLVAQLEFLGYHEWAELAAQPTDG